MHSLARGKLSPRHKQNRLALLYYLSYPFITPRLVLISLFMEDFRIARGGLLRRSEGEVDFTAVDYSVLVYSRSVNVRNDVLKNHNAVS